MKKAIVLMALAVCVSFTSHAQKNSKAQRDAVKAQKEMVTAAMVDRIVPAQNFTFVPFELNLSNSGTQVITRYVFAKITPNSVESIMPNSPGVNASKYTVDECVKKKDNWIFKLSVESNEGEKLTYTFTINAKTAAAQLRVRSNKALDPNVPGSPNTILYKGNIREQ